MIFLFIINPKFILSSRITCQISLNVKPLIFRRFYPGGKKIIPKNVTVFTNNVRNITGRDKISSVGIFGLTPRTITCLTPPPPRPFYPQSSCPRVERERIFIYDETTSKLIKDLITLKKTDKNETVPLITLKSYSGKPYSTTINENTTINDITDENLIKELQERELVKNDDGKTTVIIKLQNDSNYTLGTTKNKIKLSSLGQAYVEELNKTKSPVIFPSSSHVEDNGELFIALPPKCTPDTLIEMGKQKHLLVVHNKATDEYYAIGYLTSKKTGQLISPIQFKNFQDGKKPESKNKPQYFVKFEYAMKIDNQDVVRVEKDTEYLVFIKENGAVSLNELKSTLSKKEYAIFDNKGLTKEDCINICLNYDNNTKKGIKHPLSADQIKQNEANSKKQYEKNMAKVKEKQKANTQND